MQGLCLQAIDGAETIKHWDRLRPEVRALFHDTKINLCSYCAEDIARSIEPRPSIRTWIEVILYMETEGVYESVNSFIDRSRYALAERAAKDLHTNPRAAGYYRLCEELEKQYFD